MGFSRQEYWSGLPFPSPGDLPHPGIKLCWQAHSLPLHHGGSPHISEYCMLKCYKDFKVVFRSKESWSFSSFQLASWLPFFFIPGPSIFHFQNFSFLRVFFWFVCLQLIWGPWSHGWCIRVQPRQLWWKDWNTKAHIDLHGYCSLLQQARVSSLGWWCLFSTGSVRHWVLSRLLQSRVPCATQ